MARRSKDFNVWHSFWNVMAAMPPEAESTDDAKLAVKEHVRALAQAGLVPPDLYQKYGLELGREAATRRGTYFRSPETRSQLGAKIREAAAKKRRLEVFELQFEEGQNELEIGWSRLAMRLGLSEEAIARRFYRAAYDKKPNRLEVTIGQGLGSRVCWVRRAGRQASNEELAKHEAAYPLVFGDRRVRPLPESAKPKVKEPKAPKPPTRPPRQVVPRKTQSHQAILALEWIDKAAAFLKTKVFDDSLEIKKLLASARNSVTSQGLPNGGGLPPSKSGLRDLARAEKLMRRSGLYVQVASWIESARQRAEQMGLSRFDPIVPDEASEE